MIRNHSFRYWKRRKTGSSICETSWFIQYLFDVHRKTSRRTSKSNSVHETWFTVWISLNHSDRFYSPVNTFHTQKHTIKSWHVTWGTRAYYFFLKINFTHWYEDETHMVCSITHNFTSQFCWIQTWQLFMFCSLLKQQQKNFYWVNGCRDIRYNKRAMIILIFITSDGILPNVHIKSNWE